MWQLHLIQERIPLICLRSKVCFHSDLPILVLRRHLEWLLAQCIIDLPFSISGILINLMYAHVGLPLHLKRHLWINFLDGWWALNIQQVLAVCRRWLLRQLLLTEWLTGPFFYMLPLLIVWDVRHVGSLSRDLRHLQSLHSFLTSSFTTIIHQIYL